MAGPPSQAGRFKPRKPPKKIRTGASISAAAQQQQAAATPAPAPRSSSGGRGRGRGRGRGGRGRGRGGRAPMPRGAVFFTGNAPPTVGSKKKKATSSTSSKSSTSASSSKGSSKTAAKTPIKKEAEEEIVVGEMDVGVGGAVLTETPEQSKKASRAIKTEEEAEEQETTTSTRKTSKFEPMVDTYDSDSSDEVQDAASNQISTIIMPTELPFPVAPLPIGVGASSIERSVMYACQRAGEQTNDADEPVLMESQKDAPLVSPFVDWRDARLRQEERDSWFLLQFPTRLPELKTTGASTIPDPVKSEEQGSESVVPDATQSMASEVTTPSTNTSRFDNALAEAPPGQLGKIVVYKSGKTELVMGGDNGIPEVRMNVTEGLPCGFVQQAVAIDTDESTYVPLGDVKKTVVMTPNVEEAFSSFVS